MSAPVRPHATAVTRIPVESSQIKSVGYNEATHNLDIEFKSGGIYRYANVPREVHQALVTAPSIGSYFYKHIKPNAKKYPYQKQ